MRIKLCHAQCEHCEHATVQDLDLQIHRSGDGRYSMAAVCRDRDACLIRWQARQVADAS